MYAPPLNIIAGPLWKTIQEDRRVGCFTVDMYCPLVVCDCCCALCYNSRRFQTAFQESEDFKLTTVFQELLRVAWKLFWGFSYETIWNSTGTPLPIFPCNSSRGMLGCTLVSHIFSSCKATVKSNRLARQQPVGTVLDSRTLLESLTTHRQVNVENGSLNAEVWKPLCCRTTHFISTFEHRALE